MLSALLIFEKPAAVMVLVESGGKRRGQQARV